MQTSSNAIQLLAMTVYYNINHLLAMYTQKPQNVWRQRVTSGPSPSPIHPQSISQ